MELRKADKKGLRVAVLYGGWSAEREVSLNSGKACAGALDRAGFPNIEMIDVDLQIGSVLAEMRPDVVFNALHGKWGEDGHIQGILEILRLPYTHSGVLASALAMHKEKAKTVFKAAGLPVAESKVMTLEHLMESSPLPMPYVVKPVAEGSSVGVHIVHSESNAPISVSFSDHEAFGKEFMVERFVAGRELTCAVMGDVPLGVIDILSNDNAFYNYESKYSDDGSEHILPADLPQDIYRKIQTYTLAAHQVLGCKGVSRSDFRYDDTQGGDGDLVILETNTQPGMTGTSLVPEIAQHAGYSFEELVEWMIADASCDR